MRSSLVVVAFVIGCGPLVDGDENGVAETTGDDTTGAVAESMTMSGGSGVDDGTPPPQTTSPPDPSATMSTTVPTPEPDTGVVDDVTTDTPEPTEGDVTTSSPTDPCAPAADDDECLVCRKEACCTEALACTEAPDCACVLACLDQLEMPGVPEAMACADDCSVDFLEVVPPIVALDQCQQENCADACAS